MRDKPDFRRFVGVVFAEFDDEVEDTCTTKQHTRHHMHSATAGRWLFIPPRTAFPHRIIRPVQSDTKGTIAVSPHVGAHLDGSAAYPQIIACHTIMLLSSGSPLTPAGGSFFSFLKSRSRRRRAEVDMPTTMCHTQCRTTDDPS